jgi:hypothetical protein
VIKVVAGTRLSTVDWPDPGFAPRARSSAAARGLVPRVVYEVKHALSSRPKRPLCLSAAAFAAGGREVEGPAVGILAGKPKSSGNPAVPEGTLVHVARPTLDLRKVLVETL